MQGVVGHLSIITVSETNKGSVMHAFLAVVIIRFMMMTEYVCVLHEHRIYSGV